MGCCPVSAKKAQDPIRIQKKNNKEVDEQSCQTIILSPVSSLRSNKSLNIIKANVNEQSQDENNNEHSNQNSERNSIKSDEEEQNKLNNNQDNEDEDDYRLVNHIRIIQIVNDYYKNGDVDTVQQKKGRIQKHKSV